MSGSQGVGALSTLLGTWYLVFMHRTKLEETKLLRVNPCPLVGRTGQFAILSLPSYQGGGLVTNPLLPAQANLFTAHRWRVPPTNPPLLRSGTCHQIRPSLLLTQPWQRTVKVPSCSQGHLLTQHPAPFAPSMSETPTGTRKSLNILLAQGAPATISNPLHCPYEIPKRWKFIIPCPPMWKFIIHHQDPRFDGKSNIFRAVHGLHFVSFSSPLSSWVCPHVLSYWKM